MIRKTTKGTATFLERRNHYTVRPAGGRIYNALTNRTTTAYIVTYTPGPPYTPRHATPLPGTWPLKTARQIARTCNQHS